ncbi:MAG TPA: ACP S-malonyltransferase [Chitinispirillaceae bacterium]|nr:ACP S-malonyltransferase [Chitinispirillaceae bacterium]
MALKKLAVLFPGQGSQKPGMASDFIRCNPEAANRLKEFSMILDRDMEELLCGDRLFSDTRSVHVTMTAYAILVFEWLINKKKIDPVILAGHSLGEISALICSGAVSVEDGLRLADARGNFLAAACEEKPGGMVAFSSCPHEQMILYIGKWIADESAENSVWIVNINGPRQVVAAGDKEVLKSLTEVMKNFGVSATVLNTAGAFHTPFMNSAAKKMASFLKQIPFKTPDIPVLSSSTVRLLLHPEEFLAHLSLQIIKPVKWLETMNFLINTQINCSLEMSSSGGILTRLLKSIPDTGIMSELTGDMYSSVPEKICSVT